MKKNILILLLCITFAINAFSQITDNFVTADSVLQKNNMVNRVVAWYTDHLNWGTITLLMAVESSFIPFPSEVVVPPAAYAACEPTNASLYIADNKWINIFFVVVFATLGALIGSFVNYCLALWLGRPIVYWFANSRLGQLLLLDKEKVKKAEEYFVKHGKSSTLIGRFVPAVRQLISIPAGLAKMNIWTFSLFTALGAFLWNIVLAMFGYLAHGQKDLIQKYSDELFWLLVGIGVFFVIYLIWQKKRK